MLERVIGKIWERPKSDEAELGFKPFALELGNGISFVARMKDKQPEFKLLKNKE